MSFRSNGAYLARYLASHGYIVAAANFPLTRFGTPGGPQFTDVINQPGDVSFIIDTLLGWSAAAENRFAGCIDHERIAATGLSLGGLTTTLLAFHPEYRDPRIQAAVSVAGPVALLGEDFFDHPSIPFMMIAGDIDAMVDYQRNALQFRTWVPEATLVTLQGGSHTGFAGMAARLFRWVDNPDSVGCWAMRGTLDDALDVPDDFTSKLRGKENETLTDLDLIPCRAPELPTALRPQHQQTLTKQAVLAFLQGQFHPDREIRDAYTKILEQSLAVDNPETEVMTGQ
jgi:predicted dienelactone hydrolase